MIIIVFYVWDVCDENEPLTLSFSHRIDVYLSCGTKASAGWVSVSVRDKAALNIPELNHRFQTDASKSYGEQMLQFQRKKHSIWFIYTLEVTQGQN